MKFIHLTDTHVIGDGTLYGQDPAARLRAAVASINALDIPVHLMVGNHGDTAAFSAACPDTCSLAMWTV